MVSERETIFVLRSARYHNEITTAVRCIEKSICHYESSNHSVRAEYSLRSLPTQKWTLTVAIFLSNPIPSPLAAPLLSLSYTNTFKVLFPPTSSKHIIGLQLRYYPTFPFRTLLCFPLATEARKTFDFLRFCNVTIRGELILGILRITFNIFMIVPH